MEKLLIIKTGGTFDHIKETHGDFEDWVVNFISDQELAVETADVTNATALPDAKHFTGIIITGSHAMVTEKLPWANRLIEWIKLNAVRRPLLGICFGHQLIAEAFGGKVDHNPHGLEIGTVDIHFSKDIADDPLFKHLAGKDRIAAHVAHFQSVIDLPEAAKVLAYSAMEQYHAFRIGERTWGVQFHPEFDATAMKLYVDAQQDAIESSCHDIGKIYADITETKESNDLIDRFLEIM